MHAVGVRGRNGNGMEMEWKWNGNGNGKWEGKREESGAKRSGDFKKFRGG
jgi:hypothetical protein